MDLTHYCKTPGFNGPFQNCSMHLCMILPVFEPISQQVKLAIYHLVCLMHCLLMYELHALTNTYKHDSPIWSLVSIACHLNL